MIRPKHVTSDAILVFTRDFHQLPSGRLSPGVRCTISYDPDRIVPDGDPYTFGDPARPVTAHLLFPPSAAVTDLVLHSTSGVLQHAGTTAQGIGPTLKGEFVIPDDAAWIEIWFTFPNLAGGIEYDSNYGSNYKFRFVDQDLEVLDAAVEHDDKLPLDRLTCRVRASAAVEQVNLRYRIVNNPSGGDRKVVPLARTGDTLWEMSGERVPHRAVVQFDIEFWIAGERYKDDNQGKYYLAAEPELMDVARRSLQA
jgi:hypothetical protein